MKNLRKKLALATALFLANSLIANAIVINITSTDRGHHNNLGAHTAIDDNYSVGNASAGSLVFRNWFVFDLSFIAPTSIITSATLILDVPAGGFSSVDSTETYTLYDLEAPFNPGDVVLSRAPGNVTGQTIFANFGGGTVYGSRVYSNADNGTTTTITLNSDFLNFATSKTGSVIAFGGALTTLDLDNGTQELTFGNSGTGNPQDGNSQLQLEIVDGIIPEPSTGILSGVLVMFAMAASRRRRSGNRQL